MGNRHFNNAFNFFIKGADHSVAVFVFNKVILSIYVLIVLSSLYICICWSLSSIAFDMFPVCTFILKWIWLWSLEPKGSFTTLSTNARFPPPIHHLAAGAWTKSAGTLHIHRDPFAWLPILCFLNINNDSNTVTLWRFNWINATRSTGRWGGLATDSHATAHAPQKRSITLKRKHEIKHIHTWLVSKHVK